MLNLLKKRWYIAVIILFVIGFIFYQQVVLTKGEKEIPYKIKRQTLKEELSLSGKIDAAEKVTLRFQTSGRLSWVGVKEGDFVKKYQTMATLDQREMQKNLEKALRDYSKERWDFEEDKQVTYRSVFTDTAKRILEKNQFDLDKAVMDVEIKQLAIEYATLVSPIEGIVTRVGSPYAGVNITPAQAEFEIINPKTVYFSATAEQTDVVKLRQGASGEIILDAYPDVKIRGKIDRISFIPKTGETGTVYEVKLTISDQNEDYKYRLEMSGDVNFILKERSNIFAIPSNYIRKEKNKRYVWKKTNGKRVKTYIKIGEEVDNSIIVTSGLKEGDVIYD
jgi:macrolide-specific efflux system membrane fusion protein